MHTRHILSIVSVASLALSAAVLPVTASVVANGGFETTDGGDAANALHWTGENGTSIVRVAGAGTTGTDAAARVSNTTPVSAAGPFSQFTGDQGGDALTPGTTYNLDFDSNRVFDVGGVFQALVIWRGSADQNLGTAVNLTLTNPTTGYEHTSQSLGVAPANASQVSIEFFAITGGGTGSSSNVLIDNISVSGPTVPEPASLSLLALSGLALIRRRRA